jgi:hypothetical protein
MTISLPAIADSIISRHCVRAFSLDMVLVAKGYLIYHTNLTICKIVYDSPSWSVNLTYQSTHHTYGALL